MDEVVFNTMSMISLFPGVNSFSAGIYDKIGGVSYVMFASADSKRRCQGGPGTWSVYFGSVCVRSVRESPPLACVTPSIHGDYSTSHIHPSSACPTSMSRRPLT